MSNIYVRVKGDESWHYLGRAHEVTYSVESVESKELGRRFPVSAGYYLELEPDD